MADEQRIVQVLNNLFSNASEYAPESSVIHVDAVRDGVYIAISVTDEGQGVSPEQMPYLFRKYARGGSQPRGVGLGLAICKGIGRSPTGAASEPRTPDPDKAPRFTFTIPVAGEAGNGAMEIPTHSRRADRPKPLVLEVEDDPQFLRHVRATPNDAVFSLLSTGNSNDVCDLIDEHDSHLVLLGPAAAREGRHRADAKGSVAGGSAGHLPVRLWSRLKRLQGPRRWERPITLLTRFRTRKLVARIQAALCKSDVFPAMFQSGALVISYEQCQVTVNSVTVELTATEYDLLRILSTNTGRGVTYETLLRSAWRLGDEFSQLSLCHQV